MEVLTDSSCKSQTLQELKEADLTHIEDFDMNEDSMKKSRGLSKCDKRINNLRAVAHRTQRMRQTTNPSRREGMVQTQGATGLRNARS